MKYAIADHFPEAARRAAATAIYLAPFDDGMRDVLPQTRDIYGYCPLGIALAVHQRPAPSCPSANQVLTSLGLGQFHGEGPDRLWDAAFAFISDWDHGQITDLFDALGVERRGE